MSDAVPRPQTPSAEELRSAPRRVPVVTLLLIAANVIYFVVMVALGVSPSAPTGDQLLRFGANLGGLVVLEHEWWRAFTCMFVHIGALHLLVNMYSLWAVGSFVERLIGPAKLFVIYVLTGLAGAFAMILWDPLTVNAGASGAIFGLFGVLIGFTFRARSALPPETFASLRSSIVLTLVINVVFALTVKFLGHAAHLGGMLTGVLAGVTATASALEAPSRRATWGSQAIVLATVVAIGVLADTRTKSRKYVRWETDVQLATVALESGQWEDAVKRFTAAMEQRDDDPALHELRGNAYLQLARYEEGIADLRAGEKTPMNKNNLAWALVRVDRDLDEALALADAAVASQNNAAYLGTRCWVQVARGELKAARPDCEAAVKLSDGADLMDNGMLRYIAGDYAGAVTLWEEAAKDPAFAHDVEPWLKRAREAPAQPVAPQPRDAGTEAVR